MSHHPAPRSPLFPLISLQAFLTVSFSLGLTACAAQEGEGYATAPDSKESIAYLGEEEFASSAEQGKNEAYYPEVEPAPAESLPLGATAATKDGGAMVMEESKAHREFEADDLDAAPMASVASGSGAKGNYGSGRGRTKRRPGKKSKAKALAQSRSPVAIAQTAPASPAVMPPADAPNTEGYEPIREKNFVAVSDQALSTFSIDVDTASYSNTRRFLRDGSLPPADAVRIEEMLNYFSYDYPAPRGNAPFSVHSEVSDCPWNPDARLLHIGVQGKKIAFERTPPRNLVFLLDVSGSMNSPRKLPLLKQGLGMLGKQIRPQDRVSIVVYAGASGVVLEGSSDPDRILSAMDQLSAGGSTNGGAGIELAYRLAKRHFVEDGINRVILATDGDFNVGVSSRGALERMIEKERESGVFLSVLGFGTGNVKDSNMETIADRGNGNYAYIDSAREAHKVLVEEAGSTLVTIAKDVKLQVEFNPSKVASYRLIGYENRALAARDFNDDRKDAGEIGAGHSVTALYEVIPVGRGKGAEVDPLRYQKSRDLSPSADSAELAFLKLRYKRPTAHRSQLLSFPLHDHGHSLEQASTDFRFAAAVAEFGLVLRGSKRAPEATLSRARHLARNSAGRDEYRREFLQLIDRAAQLGADGGRRGGVAIAQ